LQVVATDYVEKRLSEPQKSSLLLASTRAQCQELNFAVREQLKNRGLIGKQEFSVNGQSFSIGDRIIFLKKDRDKQIKTFDSTFSQEKDFLVKNGTETNCF